MGAKAERRKKWKNIQRRHDPMVRQLADWGGGAIRVRSFCETRLAKVDDYKRPASQPSDPAISECKTCIIPHSY